MTSTKPSSSSSSPVLLLHSSGMSGRQWRRLGEQLAATHTVLAPDLIGYGSDADVAAFVDDADFDFNADVDRVAEQLTALGEPVHVVGHSYGGLVALTLARRFPALVRSVCVYDPVAFSVLYDSNDVEGLGDLNTAITLPVFRDEERGGSDAWLSAFIGYWSGEGAWEAMPAPARASFLRVGRKTFREVTSLGRDRTPLSSWATIAVPVLVLIGGRSPLAAQRVGTLLAHHLPQGRMTTVDGAGHMGPISHPELVNPEIAAWIVAVEADAAIDIATTAHAPR